MTPDCKLIQPGDSNVTLKPHITAVAVLSDWGQQTDELINRVSHLATGSQKPDPVALIIDDIDSGEAGHESRLDELTLAGADILVVESSVELNQLRQSPIEFARNQLAAIRSFASPPDLASLGEVTNPDGYQQFATAIAALSPEELKDIIDG